MAGKTPLADSISRIDRDVGHQSRIDAHREHRVKKTEEHRENINAHLDKHEKRRTEALEKAHAARQDAYTRAGIAENPAVARSEERLMKHLDKTEQRRADALQHVHDRRIKAEQKLDGRIARIEARGHGIREQHTNDRELRHFDREHKKEMRMADHVESPKELQLRQAREQRQREARAAGRREESMDDDSMEEDVVDAPKPHVGVFTVKTSSED